MYQRLKTLFDHISKQLKVHQKYSAIFNSRVCVNTWGNVVKLTISLLYKILMKDHTCNYLNCGQRRKDKIIDDLTSLSAVQIYCLHLHTIVHVSYSAIQMYSTVAL